MTFQFVSLVSLEHRYLHTYEFDNQKLKIMNIISFVFYLYFALFLFVYVSQSLKERSVKMISNQLYSNYINEKYLFLFIRSFFILFIFRKDLYFETTFSKLDIMIIYNLDIFKDIIIWILLKIS